MLCETLEGTNPYSLSTKPSCAGDVRGAGSPVAAEVRLFGADGSSDAVIVGDDDTGAFAPGSRVYRSPTHKITPRIPIYFKYAQLRPLWAITFE